MQQKPPTAGNPFANLLPFTIGALATALILVACDRPATNEISANDTRGPAATSPMNVQPPSDNVPAQAATPRGAPPAEALADTVISGKIKAAILTDPAMKGADVSVNTDHGVVMLAGLVKTPEQTAIASAYAQRQDGVMRVDNHLAMAPE
jgi:hypothetical protein